MSFAKIRRSDNLVVSISTTAQSPDVNDFLEVDTAFIFNAINDYRYNMADSTFYNVGPKPEIIAPTVQAVQSSPFATTDGFFFRGQGFSDGLALAGETTTIDWQLVEERWTNGVHVYLKGHAFGDKFSIDVIDKDYLYAGVLYDATYDPDGANLAWSVAAPTGVTLQPFMKDWNVDELLQGQKPLKLSYPARFLAGLYFRLTYTSIGAVDVNVCMNGLLHYKAPEV